ncbi:acetyl-CoA carboxylase biotin carboxylase subunit family protein [Mesorhizobium sp. M1004]|uniref:ATP-grasp domain-containing protein n=1 Tax=Mesorhizobium sp. M1004 TaxID=2957046 RepID=UPI003339535B
MARRALILVEGHAMDTGLLYIQAARRLGLIPIVLLADSTQDDSFAREGIEAIRVDANDLDALICECSKVRGIYDIAGITSADESLYATVGKLCRHFRLLGPNPESIERCCDKFVQRQLLAQAGVPMPAYCVAANATDVERAAVEIGLPVVLKPAVGTCSIGVRLCRNYDELAEHTTYLLDGKHIWPSSPRILVEEFAQGPQYTAQIMGNEVIGFTAAHFGPPPYFVYREFSFPALLTDDEHERIADVSLRCLRALGLGWGPTNIEVRCTKHGPVVIEVNPRLAGTPDPQLVQLAYGIDLVTEHIKLAIGGEWNLRKRHSQTAAVRFLVADRDGVLDWTDGHNLAAVISGVAEVKLYIEPKSPIVRKGDYRDTIAHVIAASDSLAQTEAILQRSVDLINWSITPFQALNEQDRPADP